MVWRAFTMVWREGFYYGMEGGLLLWYGGRAFTSPLCVYVLT